MKTLKHSAIAPASLATQAQWIELTSNGKEYVTHLCTADGGRHHGHYFGADELEKATADYLKRCEDCEVAPVRTYKVELLSPTGDSQVFVIRGLPTHPDLLELKSQTRSEVFPDTYAEKRGVNEEKDTLLVTLGHDRSLRSLPHIVRALYGTLYDEYQTSPYVLEGDRFEVTETFVRHGLSYDPATPSYAFPALVFVADGVDVIPADNESRRHIEQATQSVRRQERVALAFDKAASLLSGPDYYRLKEALLNAAV